MSAVYEAQGLCKWYGQVIALNDLSVSVGTGVIGLLGANGAGKSTFLKLLTGQLKPSKGKLTLHGQTIWNNYRLNRLIGFAPEHDGFYPGMTGLQFATLIARLHGYSPQESEKKALEALELLDLIEAKNKRIAAYSRGMRQRLKLAQALCHEAEILLLDEPLSGMDPIGRHKTINLIRKLGKEGKTLVVSSHILHEIEAMTNNVLLLHNGRLLAEGDVHQIRQLIDEHPHNIFIVCDNPRALAAKLIKYDDVISLKFQKGNGSILVETLRPDDFYSRIPKIALDNKIKIEMFTSPDDNLEAVFKYLVK
jgi:ABC-2 type transport system ATP-binding protein